MCQILGCSHLNSILMALDLYKIWWSNHPGWGDVVFESTVHQKMSDLMEVTITSLSTST